MNESHYMFTYWLMGTFFNDLESLTLGVGIVRSFESIGSCLAFGIGAAQVSPMVNLIIAFVMFFITIPFTSVAVFLVPERPSEGVKELDESASDKLEDEPAEVSKAAEAIDGPHP